MTLSPGRAFSAFPCEPNKIRRFSPAPQIFAWFDRRMCSRAPFVRGSGAQAPPFPARAFAGRLLPGQAHNAPKHSPSSSTAVQAHCFLTSSPRCKHISAPGAEKYCQLIDVWTDGPNQLNGLTRHSVVDLAINLHVADACVTVQIVNIGDAGGWFLVHG